MGTQQMLIGALVMILVGLMIVVGINIFNSSLMHYFVNGLYRETVFFSI